MNSDKDNNSNNKLAIKIPLFLSKKNNLDGLFNTHNDMITFAKNNIITFRDQQQKISKPKKAKALIKEIDKINYFDCDIGTTPSLLVQFTGYNTDLYDGFVEIDKEIPLEKKNKIGSNNNYFLLYPNISGIDKLQYLWYVLIYEDPFKDTTDIISMVKLVLKKVLKISLVNLKLPELLSELKEMKSIPELRIKLSSVSTSETNVKFKSYLVEGKFKTLKELLYKDLPVDDTNELISDNDFEDDFQKKEIKITNGSQEYRLTREQLYDAKTKISESIEGMFNVTIPILESELDRVFNHDFIKEKMTYVLRLYLSQND